MIYKTKFMSSLLYTLYKYLIQIKLFIVLKVMFTEGDNREVGGGGGGWGM